MSNPTDDFSEPHFRTLVRDYLVAHADMPMCTLRALDETDAVRLESLFRQCDPAVTDPVVAVGECLIQGVEDGDTPRLTVKHNYLALNDHVLFFRYRAGDVDTLPWPLVSEYRTQAELQTQLRTALWDCIETGEIADGTPSVLLPDGTEFSLDAPEPGTADYARQNGDTEE